MTSSGPYRSKLVNLLVRQSRQLKDQWGQQLRRVKMAATWGVQVLLYPLYRFGQVTQAVSRQLQTATTKAWQQLQATSTASIKSLPPVDVAIENLLQSIQIELPSSLQLPEGWSVGSLVSNVEIPSAIAAVAHAHAIAILKPQSKPRRTSGVLAKLQRWQSGLTNVFTSHALATPEAELSAPQSIALQGIATLLSSRDLVLVAVGNHVLDILTPKQQQQLQQRMIWELAVHRYQQRPTRRLSAQLPKLPQWRSPIAGSPSPLPLPGAKTESLPRPQGLAGVLSFPSEFRLPRLSWASLWQTAQSKLLALRAGRSVVAVTDSQQVEPQNLAISDRSDTVLTTKAQSPSLLSKLGNPLPQLLSSTWKEELLERLLASTPHRLIDWQSPGALARGDRAPSPEDSTPRRSWRLRLPAQRQTRRSEGSALSAATPSTLNSQTSKKRTSQHPKPIAHSGTAQSSATPAGPISFPGASVYASMTPGDGAALEAQVSFVGYEKHFLEQVLQGLDFAMVWLEAITAYVAEWVGEQGRTRQIDQSLSQWVEKLGFSPSQLPMQKWLWIILLAGTAFYAVNQFLF